MNLGNRYSQHSFAQIPSVNTARSNFDRSFAAKDTFDFDELVPCFVDEILPGDTCRLNVKSFARLATQVVPVMDNMYIDWFFFFVPSRLVWDNWEKFMGAQDNPGDSTYYLMPKVSLPPTRHSTIFDHFGLPTTGDIVDGVNALPFRAYNLIWNEWFRDQNLQQSVDVFKTDGPDSHTDYTLLRRGKRHDYFTSALPWPQKGNAVSLPIGGTVPVVNSTVMAGGRWIDADGHLTGATNVEINALGQSTTAGNTPIKYDPNNTLVANLSAASLVTINQLRQAFMMQSLLELDARGGTRYVEILKAHFNVVSPDFRLQRPEFLSGGQTRIQQHPVAQTSETGTSPQANLAAFSTASSNNDNIGFTKSFVEHGYVIGLMQARADITYQQGLHKMWTRETREDIFWPKLQELGEQAVLRQEIQLSPLASGLNDQVFGYQERYAEYRYMPSQIKGQFRSDFAQSLDVWHLAEEFTTAPTLNASFIQSNTPIERSLVTTSGYPHLLIDLWFDYKHARPMVTYGVPATLGRF